MGMHGPHFSSLLIRNDHINDAFVLVALPHRSHSLAFFVIRSFVIPHSLMQVRMCLIHKYIPLVDCIWIVRIKFVLCPTFFPFVSFALFFPSSRERAWVCVRLALYAKNQSFVYEKKKKKKRKQKRVEVVFVQLRVMPRWMYHHPISKLWICVWLSVCAYEFVSLWIFVSRRLNGSCHLYAKASHHVPSYVHHILFVLRLWLFCWIFSACPAYTYTVHK